ncbi:MAG: hemolysin III family protein [Gammaproteobacteria bacterium]|nr:hemolysin III family protein [Gammaproteobacteria bacterium]
MLFRTYKQRSEQFNTLTHLVGVLLAVPAVIVLVVYAAMKGDPWRIVSFSVYGLTLFTLYLFSTLYHGSRGKQKKLFQTLDHLAIYLLIAGSYTPFTLVTLQGAWGWSLFGTIWLLAVIGIIIDSFHSRGPRIVQMVIYLFMGWLILVAMYPLMQHLPTGGLVLLITGGIFYTAGIGFYALDKKIRYGHGIWHMFVVAGSASHYFAMLFYIL